MNNKIRCYIMLFATLLLSGILIINSGTITKVEKNAIESTVEIEKEESEEEISTEETTTDETATEEVSTEETTTEETTPEETTTEETTTVETVTEETTTEQTQPTEETTTSSTTTNDTNQTNTETAVVTPSAPATGVTIENVQPCSYNMSDCLMIGDSRMHDMQAFGNIHDADFFTENGLSLFYYQDKVCSINGLGNVNFDTLIHSKSYNKIYIMLGLNDLGRNFQMSIDKYTELVNLLKTAQPNAKIIICANLHVTKAYSASTSTENNPNLIKFNQTIYNNYVDNVTVFYLDSNTIFDDAEGYLRSDLTNDGVHPKAYLYANWSEYIKSESKRIFQDQ